MNNERFRGFVAVSISDEAKKFLASFVSQTRSYFSGYRFVPVENLHITLEFLGNDIDRNLIPSIEKVLNESTEEIRQFRVGLGAAGSFPEKNYPRILYVGIEIGRRKLEHLAAKVRNGLSTLGFVEDKPFQAHITLARKRRGNFQKPKNGIGTAFSWKKALDDFVGAKSKARRMCENRSGPCWVQNGEKSDRKHVVPVWVVDEVILVESTLQRSGPVYTVLRRVRLG